jgi:hypothetical protein
MAAQKYNGWTNYETWNVALWMGNDSSDYYQEIAQEIFNESETETSFTKAERATLTLADRLKEDFEENTPTVTGCYADLLSAALSEVDWHEIAEHYISDCDTSEIESDEYDTAIDDPVQFLEDACSHLRLNYPIDSDPQDVSSANRAYELIEHAGEEVNSDATN